MGEIYPTALHQNVKKVETSISILTSSMGIYQVLEELHRENWTWAKLPLFLPPPRHCGMALPLNGQVWRYLLISYSEM